VVYSSRCTLVPGGGKRELLPDDFALPISGRRAEHELLCTRLRVLFDHQPDCSDAIGAGQVSVMVSISLSTPVAVCTGADVADSWTDGLSPFAWVVKRSQKAATPLGLRPLVHGLGAILGTGGAYPCR
jgi:hypothetical protein